MNSNKVQFNSWFRVALCCLGGIGLSGWAVPDDVAAQELKIRTQRAPYFVGEAIVLEVEAIDFKIDPAIEIKNSDQPNLSVVFANSGRSTSTQIFQSGNKLIRNQIVRTTFSYRLEFTKAGDYSIGPFEAVEDGKKFTHPAVTFKVADIETTTDMKVEIDLPGDTFYPGQQVPMKIRWIYSGDDRIRNLTIRNELFERFKFKDQPLTRRQSAIPITTSQGVQAFPAEFSEQEIDGRPCIVGVVERTLLLEKPESVHLPPTFVSFHRLTGSARRSNSLFDSFRENRSESIPFKGIGEPVSFVVKPFPAIKRPDTFRGAIGSDFAISTSVNRQQIRTGDPMTLQINIQGQGNIESMSIPPLDSSLNKEDFDWPAGEMPGVTEADQKQFSITLRARNKNLTEIPPIAFSYFDPQQEEYVTVRSKPIPIDVSQGELVSSKDIVGQISKGGVASEKGNDLDLAIETNVDRLFQNRSIAGWLEPLAYFIGILILGLSLLARKAGESQSKGPASGRHRIQLEKKQLAKWQKDLEPLVKGKRNATEQLARLSDHLRLLQNIFGQQALNQSAVNKSTAESSWDQSLDDLVADIDRISFRPTEPTKDELHEMIQRAQKISAELGQA